MTTDQRRKEIMKILRNSDNNIKGTNLADELNVSRQVIVQDIAILRASGVDILATPVGYVLPKYDKNRIIESIATKHFNIDQVEEELMIIINNGATVLNVIVDHPIYGEVEGALNISCKDHVDKFLERIRTGKAEFLSSLTKGVHVHTIEVPNNESFITIKEQLKQKGYLVEEL